LNFPTGSNSMENDLNWKNHHGPFSPRPAQLGAKPSPSPCASRPVSHYRVVVANKRGPPVSSVFPQILPCSAQRVLTSKFSSLSRPPIECLHHLNVHLFTYHREPLRQLRCAVASHRRCPLHCCHPSLLQPGCLRQELDDEVLSRLPCATPSHPLAVG
jgi:hypothetical protein